MDLFGVGIFEALLVLVVALIVVGPNKFPEIARSAGDIILLKGGVEKINTIFSIAKDSFSRIKQNLFFAFIYNAAMIPVAIDGKISPRYAAIAMALSSISVVLNSSRRIKI